jgi:hypothetical protein
MKAKQVCESLLNLILDLTHFFWVKMDKHKTLLLSIFATMIIMQIIRWIN